MEKKNKIYTKTGDDGTTGLVGGSRVKKFDVRLEAYGTVDELNTQIGIILAHNVPLNVQKVLLQIQNRLFNIGSQLATDKNGEEITAGLSVKQEDIHFLEVAIDRWEEELPALTQFILPGGTVAAAHCHLARTVCRRAERRILEFAETQNVQQEIIHYMNRLSDLMFVLSRKLNYDDGVDEQIWEQK